MTAEIISVGTELLLGNILNNAQFLSQELAALGITVQRQSTIGDNHDRLAEWVEAAKARADLLVFTGGLGPTADDLTKETVAACYGDSLTFDPEEWEKITSFFARMGRQTTPNNRKQAMVPVHGQKIPNAHGTAPGAWFEQEGRCAVLMPGVPAEMKAMWAEQVRPRLLARQNCTLHSLTLRVLGGESDIEYRVRGLLKNENPTAAIYCKTGESEIRITARAASDQDGAQMCRAYAKKFYDLLEDAVYDEDVPGLAHTVVHTLAARGLTLSTAESCTGGMIAQQLTGVPGASDVFGYGFVTYWEQAKARLLGVDPAVIERYNVVSGPVAAQMVRVGPGGSRHRPGRARGRGRRPSGGHRLHRRGGRDKRLCGKVPLRPPGPGKHPGPGRPRSPGAGAAAGPGQSAGRLLPHRRGGLQRPGGPGRPGRGADPITTSRGERGWQQQARAGCFGSSGWRRRRCGRPRPAWRGGAAWPGSRCGSRGPRPCWP